MHRSLFATPVPKQNSAYTIIDPYFYYGYGGKGTCYIRELDLEMTIAIYNPTPDDKPWGVQRVTASVGGKYIGDFEMSGSNIKVRIDNQTNSFEILVNGSPVLQSSAPVRRP